jgi:predicted metallopeptidase
MLSTFDILILSNAPGELTTWVYPVLLELAKRSPFNHDLRISIVLSPCTHASGQEAAIAQGFPMVDRVLAPEYFYDFLLWGQSPWDWHQQGIVIFLGGDQIFPVVIGKRLGYNTIVYAEWDTRWLSWIDRFAVRDQTVLAKIPAQFAHKAAVVGDLMVDVRDLTLDHSRTLEQKIVFMPGSKGMKLAQGVPLCLGVADVLSHTYPDMTFAIALAPTLTPQDLAKFAQMNPVVTLVEGTTAKLVEANGTYELITPLGTKIKIYTKFPAQELLQTCQLCITTVGANTAQLAALAVPMVILLPTNQLDAMRSWDGIVGILANLPVVGQGFAKLINYIVVRSLQRRSRLFAWANIWAGEEIVPELLGHLNPQKVAAVVIDLLEEPQKLTAMRDRLQQICGRSGASAQIVNIVENMLRN